MANVKLMISMNAAMTVQLNNFLPTQSSRGGHMVGLNFVNKIKLRLAKRKEPIYPCVEICMEERELGNGGCGACALCCKEATDTVEILKHQMLLAKSELGNLWMHGDATIQEGIIRKSKNLETIIKNLLDGIVVSVDIDNANPLLKKAFDDAEDYMITYSYYAKKK